MHNTCEDSLLATPLMIDLIVLCELCERISISRVDSSTVSGTTCTPDSPRFTRFHSVLSLLSYLLKAPLVPTGMPVINALNAQRLALVNVFRACVGLPPEDFMLLEHRVSDVPSFSVSLAISCLTVVSCYLKIAILAFYPYLYDLSLLYRYHH